MPTPEGEFKKEVGDFLKKLPLDWLVLRLSSGVIRKGSRFIHLCPEGTSDYLICCPDPRWLELKVKGQVTKKTRVVKQAEFGEKVKALGMKHAICHTIEEVKEFLKWE